MGKVVRASCNQCEWTTTYRVRIDVLYRGEFGTRSPETSSYSDKDRKDNYNVSRYKIEGNRGRKINGAVLAI